MSSLREKPRPAGRATSQSSRSAHETPLPEGDPEIAHGAIGRLSDDELTQQDICAALLAAEGVDAASVEVEMTGRGVCLRGSVPTPADLTCAVDIARSLARGRPVQSMLELQSDVTRETDAHFGAGSIQPLRAASG
jgi:hypothetical protein